MTPAESIPLTHLPQSVIATLTGYSPRSVWNWIACPARCPPEVASWLERHARYMQADPPPKKLSPTRK